MPSPFIKLYISIVLICTTFFHISLQANETKLQRIESLTGNWKFSIGDNMNWSAYNFEDSDWESIRVPGNWENQGFHGYDGYAWYRNEFTVDVKYASSSLYLSLGYIDDVDEVYVNGKLIGKRVRYHQIIIQLIMLSEFIKSPAMFLIATE